MTSLGVGVLIVLNTQQWALSQFGSCDLGDKRRSDRLVRIAEAMAENPGGSIPTQTRNWADTKAAYRLFASPHATFQIVAKPHYEMTRGHKGRVLIISDTTELNFTSHPCTTGLATQGNGTTRGLMLHNALAVAAESREIIGLAGQTCYYRKAVPKGESKRSRLKRRKESDLWGELVDQIGSAPESAEHVHIFDRGGDNYEALCHVRNHGSGWVVRAAKTQRKVLDSRGNRVSLREVADNAEVVGSYDLQVRTRSKEKARTARLEVRVAQVAFPRPKHQTAWVKTQPYQQIDMNVVVVRETSPRPGCKPIEWILLTSLPASTFDDAWVVIEYYETRWLIEEFHKSLKTGCAIESRQLQSSDRLEPLAALLSIVAVRLLHLKTIASKDRKRAARGMVPTELLRILKQLRPRLRSRAMTVETFIREVAKLGGFLGRKSDGAPGWQTIWRGWSYLQTLSYGASLAAKRT